MCVCVGNFPLEKFSMRKISEGEILNGEFSVEITSHLGEGEKSCPRKRGFLA